MAKKLTHGRAPGKTQISISLPQDLVEKIDRLAAAENRNRSNFIATHLESLAETVEVSEVPKRPKTKKSK